MNVYQFIVSAGVALLVVSGSPLGTVAAQTVGAQGIWDNDRIQVRRISLAPGETLTGESPGGSVVVFLTADLDGRMPAAEAAWRDPGPLTMENRGRGRFEAPMVDLKGSVTRSGGATAPEVLRAVTTVAPRSAYDGTSAMMQAQNLILNDRISVTKQRYAAGLPGSVDPLHFHPQDAIVIYLRGGYTWPATSFSGPDRVRRGDVRVVPANVLHTTGNTGSDPLEFLLIIPT